MLNNKQSVKLKGYQWVVLLAWVVVLAAFLGWLFETAVYQLMYEGYDAKRGSSRGPWIPIFGFGALLIMITTVKLRKNPLLTFLTSAFACGLLEYLTGWVLYYRLGGIRLWNYADPDVFFGWGNMEGFVCPVSMAVFGLAALILQYLLFPVLAKLVQKIKHPVVLWLTTVPTIVFLADVITFSLQTYFQ